MWKMMCGMVAVVFVTAAIAVEQSTSDENRWLPTLQNSRPSRSIRTRDWVAQPWRPDPRSIPTRDLVAQAWPLDTDFVTPSSYQRWSAEDDRTETGPWEPQEALGAVLHFDSHGNLDDDIGNSEEAMLEMVQQQERPVLAKRQAPRRLGSVMDLYKDVAHGLNPFVVSPENQLLAKPERRSGRRPAACRFGPFGFVCWHAATRRGAAMRQRSAQYVQ